MGRGDALCSTSKFSVSGMGCDGLLLGGQRDSQTGQVWDMPGEEGRWERVRKKSSPKRNDGSDAGLYQRSRRGNGARALSGSDKEMQVVSVDVIS